jgi:hypothetical protein
VTQVVECLPNMLESLNSRPSTAKTNKQTKTTHCLPGTSGSCLLS